MPRAGDESQSVRVERRALRAKLDPRLDLLLGLGRQPVAALRRRELTRLGALARELLDAQKVPGGKPLEVASSAWSSIAPRIFCPFTTGLRLPGETHGVPAELHSSAVPLLAVLVRTALSSAGLAQLGFRVRSRAGERVSAWLPWTRLEGAALERLLAEPGIVSIELARALRFSLDRAMQSSALGAIHAHHQGRGVLIGVADRFLDIHHADFAATTDGYAPALDGDGPLSTRIVGLWDQELSAGAAESAPATLSASASAQALTSGLDYGVEWTQAEIEATIARGGGYRPVRHRPPFPFDSTSAHGTMVAGCALGNGASTPTGSARREGAAPLAQLVFVHFVSETASGLIARAGDELPSLGLVDSSFLLDACSFVFARAEDLALPCVLSLSQNDLLGPHDGTSALESHIDALLDRPGRAAVLAAGNEHANDSHASGTLTGVGATFDLDVVFGNSSAAEELEIWYSGADSLSASVDVSAMAGKSAGTLVLASAANSSAGLIRGSDLLARLASSDPAPNGSKCFTLHFLPDPTTGLIANGTYRIRLHALALAGADCSFQAWLSRNSGGTRFANPDKLHQTIATPATARRAVAVGSYELTATPPALSGTSGHGPTRDGRHAPDLSCPTGVLAPLAFDRSDPAANPGTEYWGLSGTSAAAPLAAGAAAIVFECHGSAATWQDVRDYLRNSTSTAVSAFARDAWGAGMLDASKLCDRIPSLPRAIDTRHLRYEVFPEDLLPIFEIFPPPKPVPPPPLPRVALSFTLGWPRGEAGFRLSVESGARALAVLELELPLERLPVQFASLRKRRSLARKRYGELAACELLGLEGASFARVEKGRVVVGLRPDVALLVPRLRLGSRGELRLSLRMGLLSGQAQLPVLRLEQFDHGQLAGLVRLSDVSRGA